jgi:hypothetical protein
VQYLDRLPPEAFWGRYAEMEERIRATAAVLPSYGVAGWGGLVMIGDWQWENEQLVSIGLAHGAPADESKLHVHTTVRDPTADVTSLRMAAVRPAWDDKDEMLRRLREFGTVAGESSTIAVDAAPVEFTVWGEAGRWWAAGHHDGFGLVLEGQRIPIGRVELVRIHDLDPYLAGRRAYLRALRGES